MANWKPPLIFVSKNVSSSVKSDSSAPAAAPTRNTTPAVKEKTCFITIIPFTLFFESRCLARHMRHLRITQLWEDVEVAHHRAMRSCLLVMAGPGRPGVVAFLPRVAHALPSSSFAIPQHSVFCRHLHQSLRSFSRLFIPG